jgi:hypothetical protein
MERSQKFPDETVSEFPDETVSEFPDGTVSEFPDETVSEFPDGTVSKQDPKDCPEITHRWTTSREELDALAPPSRSAQTASAFSGTPSSAIRGRR